jgi:putative ABC transport system permease protein
MRERCKRFVGRLRFAFRRERFERELEEEMRLHLELRMDEHLAAGLPPDQARRAAARQFGNITLFKEESRALWGFALAESVAQDLRYALRVLRRSPAFATAAVLTLALGIGANTTIFTIVNAILLRPLPVTDPGSMVRLYRLEPNGGRGTLFSYSEYAYYRDQNTRFSGLVAYRGEGMVVGPTPGGAGADRDAETIVAMFASANYFGVLGKAPALGRGFLPEEELEARSVVVLSHAYWWRRFGADPGIVGKGLVLNNRLYTVVGIGPEGFGGLDLLAAEVWIPLGMFGELGRRIDRDSLLVRGRLRPEATLRQARAEMDVLAARIARLRPDTHRDRGVIVNAASTLLELDSFMAMVLTPVFAAVGLVLAIACANVANLLLARASARQREVAVRLSLGASRGRLLRQLLTESALVGLVGAGCGLLASHWTLDSLYTAIVASIPPSWGTYLLSHRELYAVTVQPDLRIFGYTLALALGSTVLFGLAPALQAARADLATGLHQTVGGGSRGAGRLRNSLVVAQLGGSLVLLISAGLLVRGLSAAHPGFDTGSVLLPEANLRVAGYDAPRAAAFRRDLFERLRSLPGVESVAVARVVPLDGGVRQVVVRPEGVAPPRDGRPPRANYTVVSPDYFATLWISIIRGRNFTDEEARSGARVALLSEATARQFWPDQDPIGKRIDVGAPLVPTVPGDDPAPFLPGVTVIGIVRDLQSVIVWQKERSYVYLPIDYAAMNASQFLVRVSGGRGAVLEARERVRAAVRTLDPSLPLQVREMDEILGLALLPFRAAAILSATLGLLAFVMASVGVYGVMAYTVSRRTHEIGVRMALGARTGQVLGHLLASGFRLIGIGLAAGLIASVAASRLIAGVLFGISPLDPVTFTAASLCLGAVALAAIYVPARRAMKLDPAHVLRHE